MITENQFYDINHLISVFKELKIDKQIEKIEYINENYDNKLDILTQLLMNRKETFDKFPNHVDGLIYDILYNSKCVESQELLKQVFPNGIVPLNTAKNIEYKDLQKLLAEKKFLEADKMTQQKLCQLADLVDREWLYFTDVARIPDLDLYTIDKLWRIHSLNKFGFSIQRNIWIKSNQDWNILWKNIGWSINNSLCEYPNEFIWQIEGPRGHLPLSNQLRGVQTLSALFNHKAWINYLNNLS